MSRATTGSGVIGPTLAAMGADVRAAVEPLLVPDRQRAIGLQVLLDVGRPVEIESADLVGGLLAVIDALTKEADRLDDLLNTPEVHDFAKAVALEALHQRERWDAPHDEGKTHADWFWLIGYLAGKALHNPPRADATGQASTTRELRAHRIVATAAACCNWHAAAMGTDTRMRPGIAVPVGATGE